VNRCLHTAYGYRVRSEAGVHRALYWPTSLGAPTQVEDHSVSSFVGPAEHGVCRAIKTRSHHSQQAVASVIMRPFTAPVGDMEESGGSCNTLQLGPGKSRIPPSTATSPRFAARTEFEGLRAQAVDP